MKAIARAAFECEEKPPSPLARKIVTEIVVLAAARAIGRSINFFCDGSANTVEFKIGDEHATS